MFSFFNYESFTPELQENIEDYSRQISFGWTILLMDVEAYIIMSGSGVVEDKMKT